MQLFSFLLYQEFFPKCCEIFGCILYTKAHYKQLLDEVFVISRIIKVEVQCRGYQPKPTPRLQLITLTKTLIILDITKTESNCFIIH